MERGWVIACLFLGLASNMVSGETVACMETRGECARSGFSSMSVVNNHYYCCAPGFSMSVINTMCFCTRVSEAMNCSSGPVACRHAAQMTSDGQGNTLCCPQGFSMSSQVISVNGLQSSSCSCVRPLLGGLGGSFQIINGNGVISTGNVNATAVEGYIRNWRRRFRNTMSQGMRYLNSQMHAMTDQLNLMRNRMTAAFSNMFRGW